jgi:iron complex outermembrane receptor protein
VLSLALACGAASGAQSESGSNPADDSGSLEEIVITSRLRDERLQDVPASVSVLGASQLEQASAKNLIDVASLLPNMRFTQGYRPGVVQIAMRGIETVQGGETPVAVVVDGVQLPAIDFINQNLLDIESIEVLRGPQGSLYGRGALAGAISINTRKPTDTFAGQLRANYGNGDTQSALVELSGPILSDRVLGKIALTHASSDGFTPDAITGEPLDGSWLNAARGELLLNPGGDTQITVGGAASRRREGANAFARIAAAQIGDFSLHPAHNLASNDVSTLRNAFLKIEQKTPIGMLTSISQYANSRSVVDGEGDFRADPIAEQINVLTYEAFNQDLRLTSPEDRRFRWLVGAFFQDRKGKVFADIHGDPAGANPGAPLGHIDNRDRSTASAVYTRLDLDATEKLALTAGLRYDRDEREDGDLQFPTSQVEHTFTSVQPQVTASFHHTSDLLSYVTVGKGFRSGGFNRYTSTVLLGLPRLYPAETLWNYEAGIKSQWLDHRLTLNAAVFYMEMTDIQFFLQRQLPSAQYVTHFNKADVKGTEIEATLQPFAGLMLSASLGINDSRIDDFDGTSLNVGNRLPNSYDPTWNFAGQYSWPMRGRISGLVRVDYQHLGEVFYNQTDLFRFGPTDYLNARAAIQTDSWTLALWGKNLTDERAPRNFSPQSCGVDCSGRMDNLPRTYGVEVIVQF